MYERYVVAAVVDARIGYLPLYLYRYRYVLVSVNDFKAKHSNLKCSLWNVGTIEKQQITMTKK